MQLLTHVYQRTVLTMQWATAVFTFFLLASCLNLQLLVAPVIAKTESKLEQGWHAYRSGEYEQADKLYKDYLAELAGKNDSAQKEVLERLAVLYSTMNLEPKQIANRLNDQKQRAQVFDLLISRYGEEDKHSLAINEYRKSVGELPAGDSSPAADNEAKPSLEPADSKMTESNISNDFDPEGYAVALELYERKCYLRAKDAFADILNAGKANDKVHVYLSDCLYNLRQYNAAIKEYDWLAEHAAASEIRDSAKCTSYRLKCYLTGTCPGACLKADDPRWKPMKVDGHPANELWMRFDYPGGYQAWSRRHIGESIEFEESGRPVNKGKCPICNGTTKVPRIGDGDELPF